MSSLAKILLKEGYIVLGADYLDYYYTEDGLDIHIENINDIKLDYNYLYIIGNAFTNSLVFNKIKKLKYKYMLYPEFIEKHFRNYFKIAVAGSHGKTSTTKLISSILPKCSYLIGDGEGYSNKNNKYFVFEACEYKNTFLNYYPDIALILNIDYDHPDFFKNVDDYILSFKKFISQSKLVIINGDDINSKKIINNSMITFGVNKRNDVYFDYECKSDKTIIRVHDKEFVIPFVGSHYAYNFVGSYIIFKLLRMSDSDIKIDYNLPKRRLEKIIKDDIIYIADYAHHPTEIKCLHQTLILSYNKKIIVFFEPHTLSRTKALLKDFKSSLDLFDECYLLPVFLSVREEKDDLLEHKLYEYLNYKKINKNDIKKYIKKDCINLFLGAGDIYNEFKKIELENL